MDHMVFKKGLIAGLGLVSLLLGLMILMQCCMGFDGGGLSPAVFWVLLITGLLIWSGLFYLFINGYRLAGVSHDHWRYGRTMSSRDVLSLNQAPQGEPGEWRSLLKELIPVIAVVLGIFIFGIVLRSYRASNPVPFDLVERDGAADQMTLLLKANPDQLNERNDAGETLLTAGVLAGRVEIIESLLAFRIDVEQLNNEGKTALMLAAGQPEVVAMLLKSGADPAVSDLFGWTALHHAVWQQCEESVKLLLQAEAPVNLRDREGRTPLILALENGFKGIQPLLTHGATISSFNAKGEMPLHVAARNNRPDAVRLLLHYGADPAVYSRLGWAPLHVAALHNAIEAAEVLLESGVDPDQVNEREQSPMQCAVRNSSAEVVELLLQHGSAVDPAEAEKMIASRPFAFKDYESRVRLNEVKNDEPGLMIQEQETQEPELRNAGRQKEMEALFNLHRE